eukprot:Clim_evm20s10 gene=Clim_evmTU20s10
MYAALQQQHRPDMLYNDVNPTSCELRVVWAPGCDFGRFSTVFPENLLEGKISRVDYDLMITELNNIVDQIMNEYKRHYSKTTGNWDQVGPLAWGVFPFRYVYRSAAEPGHRRRIEALEDELDILAEEYSAQWKRTAGVSIGISHIPISDRERKALKHMNKGNRRHAWRRFQQSEPIVVIRAEQPLHVSTVVASTVPPKPVRQQYSTTSGAASSTSIMDRTTSETTTADRDVTMSADSLDHPPPYAPPAYDKSWS